jgi:hypothetical protein
MRKVKRTLVVLAIFTLSSIGITYAEGNASNQISNFFMGGVQLGSENVNQVLALLVGPKGTPGPAGVAGANGFDGINGLNGKDGIPGAPGPVGPQGPAGASGGGGAGSPGANGVGIQAFQLSAVSTDTNYDSNCPNGGTKFVTTDGATTTYACNGSGGSGGGSGGLSNGQLSISACVNAVGLSFNQNFTGTDFRLASVKVTGVASNCAGQNLSVYFPIKSATPKYGTATTYALGNQIKCTVALASNMFTGSNTTIIVADTAQANNVPAATCVNTSTSNTSIALGDISTQDLGGTIGFTLAN